MNTEHQDTLPSLSNTPVDTTAWEGTLNEMRTVLVSVLMKKGLDCDTADEFCAEQVIAIAQFMGGRQLYLPRGKKLMNALRDASIWQDFDGCNVNELVSKYNLSHTTIYEILRRQRDLQNKKRQKDLFCNTG